MTLAFTPESTTNARPASTRPRAPSVSPALLNLVNRARDSASVARITFAAPLLIVTMSPGERERSEGDDLVGVDAARCPAFSTALIQPPQQTKMKTRGPPIPMH